MEETTFLQWCWDFFWNEANDGAKRAEEYILQLEHSRPERAAQARHLLTLLPAHFSHSKHAQRTLTDLARRLGSDAPPPTKDRDYIDACRLIDAKETSRTMTRSPYDELIAAASVLAIALPDIKTLGIARDLLIRDAHKYRPMVVEHAATRKDLFDDLRFFADNRAPRGISDELYMQGAKTLLAFCTVTLGMVLELAASAAIVPAESAQSSAKVPSTSMVPESQGRPSGFSLLLDAFRNLITSISVITRLLPESMFWREFNSMMLEQPPAVGGNFFGQFNRRIVIEHDAINPHSFEHNYRVYTLLRSYDRYDPHDTMLRRAERFFPYRLDDCADPNNVPAAMRNIDATHRIIVKNAHLHLMSAQPHNKVLLPIVRVRTGIQFIPYAVTILCAGKRIAVDQAWIDDIGQLWFDPARYMTLRTVDIEVLYAVWEDDYMNQLPIVGSMLHGDIMAGREAILFPPRGVDSYAARCEIAFPNDIVELMRDLQGKRVSAIVHGVDMFFSQYFAYGSNIRSAWRIRNAPGRNDLERIAHAHVGNCFDVNRLAFIILQKLGVACRMRDGFGAATVHVKPAMMRYEQMPVGTVVQPSDAEYLLTRDESVSSSNAMAELHAFLEWFDADARRWRVLDVTPMDRYEQIANRNIAESNCLRLGIAPPKEREKMSERLSLEWMSFKSDWGRTSVMMQVNYHTTLRLWKPRGSFFVGSGAMLFLDPGSLSQCYTEYIDNAKNDATRLLFSKNFDALIGVFIPFFDEAKAAKQRVFANLVNEISSGVYAISPDLRRKNVNDMASSLQGVSEHLSRKIVLAIIEVAVPPLCMPRDTLPMHIAQYDDQTFIVQTAKRTYLRSNIADTTAILIGLLREWEREAAAIIDKLSGIGRVIPYLADSDNNLSWRVSLMAHRVLHNEPLPSYDELRKMQTQFKSKNVQSRSESPPVSDPLLLEVSQFVAGNGTAVVKKRSDGKRYMELTTKDPVTGKTTVIEID